MSIPEFHYVKRYRMERELTTVLARPTLPESFSFVGWQPGLLSDHAHVKYECFVGGADADLFECLGDRSGCEELMVEIVTHRGFLPSATWLVVENDHPVGTVQAVRDGLRRAVIPNLGVAPEARRRGIGVALMLKVMHSLRDLGMRKVWLEVTADNLPAVKLYRQLGFKRRMTLFRPAERRKV